MLKVVVHSHKGGPGKTTIASSLAVCLALSGKRVGVMDMDLAGPGLHVIFGLAKKDMKFTLSDALHKKCSARQAVLDLSGKVGVKKGKLVFVPGAYKTESIVSLLQKGYELATLRKVIRDVTNAYSLDFLIIDTRPGIDESTMLAIGLCDVMLLITRIDRQDIFGTGVTLDVARVFKKPVFLVANMIPAGEEKRGLEKSLTGMFHVPIATTLQYYSDVQNNLSSGIFVLKFPDHEFSSKMRSLASTLVELKDKFGATEPVYKKSPIPEVRSLKR